MEEEVTTRYPSYNSYVELWAKSTTKARCNVRLSNMADQASRHVAGLVTRFDDNGVIRMALLCSSCKCIMTEDAVLV